MKRNNNVSLNVYRRNNNVVVVKGNKTNTKVSISSKCLVCRPKNRMIIKDWGINRPGNIIPVRNLKDLQMVRREYSIIEFEKRKE